MAKIKQLKTFDKTEDIFPITKAKAVYNDDGDSMEDVMSDIKDRLPFKFGVENDRYGYYKMNSSVFTPFQNHMQCLAVFPCTTNKITYTFDDNYDSVYIVLTQGDSDNNADNWMKVYNIDKGAYSTNLKNDITDAWTPYKPSGTVTYAATSFTNAQDQNTVVLGRASSYYYYLNVQYKYDIKENDIIYIYCSHVGGNIYAIFGVKADI